MEAIHKEGAREVGQVGEGRWRHREGTQASNGRKEIMASAKDFHEFKLGFHPHLESSFSHHLTLFSISSINQGFRFPDTSFDMCVFAEEQR